MAALRVVLADDHEIWRSGLRKELADGFWIMAEASTAAEAIEVINRHRPDLALVDLQMPDGGGRAVVNACAPVCPIVILSVSEAERDILDCVAAGAVGYLTKATDGDGLRSALRTAAAGDPVFSPGLANLVLAEFRSLGKAAGATGALSDREREVLLLIARGYTYAEVGEALHIARKTAENHVRRILDKLHLSRRDQLVRFVADHGLDP